MSTGCDFHADTLGDMAAGRMSASDESRVRAHLATCPRCRDDLELLAAVARTRPVPPADLEERIRAAVREAVEGTEAAGLAGAGAPQDPPAGPRLLEPRPTRVPSRRARRPWALPWAAAAGLALFWVALPDRPAGSGGDPGAADATEIAVVAPYGTWPADGAVVAGEPVLSELSAEDLEHLLEAMEL